MSKMMEYEFVLWVPSDMYDSLCVLADTTGVRVNDARTVMRTHPFDSKQSSVAMVVDLAAPHECQLALNLALVAVGMGATIGKSIIPALENGAKRTQEE